MPTMSAISTTSPRPSGRAPARRLLRAALLAVTLVAATACGSGTSTSGSRPTASTEVTAGGAGGAAAGGDGTTPAKGAPAKDGPAEADASLVTAAKTFARTQKIDDYDVEGTTVRFRVPGDIDTLRLRSQCQIATSAIGSTADIRFVVGGDDRACTDILGGG